MNHVAVPSPPRYWEVDTLRGIAIVLMIFYHFMWDLSFFGVAQVDMLSSGWQTFARSIGSTFIFVMGVSLTLSDAAYQQKTGQTAGFGKYLRRGLKILAWGMVITIATYFAIGPGFVIFGILHLLGAAIILAFPFLRSRWAALTGALVFIAAGFYIDTLLWSQPWGLWLGIKQVGRGMVDYYPLIPWFGIALLGVFAGLSLYPQPRQRLAVPDLSQMPPIRGLRFLGRHSLLIYLTHQPILIGLLFVLGLASF